MKNYYLLVLIFLFACKKNDLTLDKEEASGARLATTPAQIIYGVPGLLPDIKIIKGEYGWTTSTGWLGIESAGVTRRVAGIYDANEYGYVEGQTYKFWSFRCPFANVAPYSREGLYDWTLIQGRDGHYNPTTRSYYYDGVVEYETYRIEDGYGRLYHRNDKVAFFPNYPYTKTEVKNFIFKSYDGDTVYIPGGGTSDLYYPYIPVPEGNSEIVEVITADPYGHWVEYNNNKENNMVAVGADITDMSAVLDESNIARALPEPARNITYTIAGKGKKRTLTLSWADTKAGEYCIATPWGTIIEDVYDTSIVIPLEPKFKSGTFHVKSMNPGIGDAVPTMINVK